MAVTGARANVGPYVLGELLGTGGTSRVFAAESPSRRRVAVKVLHDVFVDDPILCGRVAEEARAANQVRHSNVVRIYEHGTTAEGVPYLAMERLRGTPLGIIVRQEGPLPLARIRRIAIQLLAGLAAVHAAGLVHGDVKSDNVIVGPHNRVTLIDFGLARASGTGIQGLGDHVISGTPEYMAPELIRGMTISPKAEIYAVGMIVYEMLTGSTAFGGGATTAIFERHLTDDVVPPSLRYPDREVPVALESLVVRALAKDPGARHINADMFAAGIERAIPPRAYEKNVPARRAFTTRQQTLEWTQRLPVPKIRAA